MVIAVKGGSRLGALRTLGGSSRPQLRSPTGQEGLGLPLFLFRPQLPQVEWLVQDPKDCMSLREIVFWDWTFLTPNGRE